MYTHHTEYETHNTQYHTVTHLLIPGFCGRARFFDFPQLQLSSRFPHTGTYHTNLNTQTHTRANIYQRFALRNHVFCAEHQRDQCSTDGAGATHTPIRIYAYTHKHTFTGASCQCPGQKFSHAPDTVTNTTHTKKHTHSHTEAHTYTLAQVHGGYPGSGNTPVTFKPMQELRYATVLDVMCIRHILFRVCPFSCPFSCP